MLKRLENPEYAFTFQTQSIFDASVPNVPSFVYTDHTHLAKKSTQGLIINAYSRTYGLSVKKNISERNSKFYDE